ncbi:ankyrin repeat and SAM domain-containing protein 4B [Microcaecilia unicolor]|uniref:Ankyrin repeat and SAM domain-containing protein 4B n=1 Tax=Microcaecilia unicolor TaxID=1415580 RepID=A0A6P7YYM9_9AMPH|nr:ankyrin repeat and SAM domain-containing protein 4B [Microcaecilia unicolor]
MSTRYHQAAIDGYIDLLKEATRKDLNVSDEDGMSPTLLAAYHGHVEVMELICSRGGDPNKCDIWGNTPLHHAASNGHVHCVSFLLNFGANVFALDNDFCSPLDVAARKDQTECVAVLDKAATTQNLKNPKRVARQKEQAKKDAQKHIKECERVQRRHQSEMDRNHNKEKFGSVSSAKGTVCSTNFATTSSHKTLGTLTTGLKETLTKKLKMREKNTVDRKIETNVIFVKDENSGSRLRTKAIDVFNENDENEFSADFQEKNSMSEANGQMEQNSIFNRPGLGNIVFSRNLAAGINADLEEMPSLGEDIASRIPSELFQHKEDRTADELERGDDFDLSWNEEEIGLDEDGGETAPLQAFLASQNLSELLPMFMRDKIDLDALMLCSDTDLQSIHMQLGPRKKVLNAIQKRKRALETPGKIADTNL